MINKIENVEKLSQEKQKEAKKESDNIIKKANKDAENLIMARVKEANVKAGLRINFAKNTAEENVSKSLKECKNKVKEIKHVADEKKEKVIKTIIATVIS